MVNKQALKGYGRGAVESELDYASPHRIIQMLMDGALSKMAIAKGCIARNDSEGRLRHITWAVNIISGLRASLDQQQGGDIAGNLDSLYDYMCNKLHEANINNVAKRLDEVIALLTEIKAGWDGIPPEFH
ncbi:hypothetical protein LCGC14_1248010 [marine sediment metagenome]|uniref:Flagellar secretion chaperone FliS n=1 Tax=marine sediment metagenome TaxID=412755 RepID=A0A0F9L7M5_9ZZZZ